MNNVLMSAGKRPNLLASKGHFTARIHIWHQEKKDCIISDVWHTVCVQLLYGLTSMINVSLLEKI